MNQRSYDIMSIGVDVELEKLLRDFDDAWYGERRDYGTDTDIGDRSAVASVGIENGETDNGEENLAETPRREGGEGPAQAPQAPRSKAPNYYGPPE